MKFGLDDITIDKFHAVFEKYAVIDAVIIYGSRAMGNYREGSDIDITLKGEALTEDTRSKVWLDLDDLNSPYLIDLSIFHQLSSEPLVNHINAVGKIFYRKAPYPILK